MGYDSELEKSAQKEMEKKKLLQLAPIAKYFGGNFPSKSFHLYGTAASSTSSVLTKKACIYKLKACKSFQQLNLILAQVLTLGLQQDLDILHKIMAFAADPFHGNIIQAEKISHGIEKPSIFIYNLMVKGYVKSGSFHKALSLFDNLRANGLRPDNYTYPFVFKAVGRIRNVLLGEKFRGLVVKTGVAFDCFVSNSILDMYGEVGCVGSLKKVFDEMPDRDLVSWNVMISGLVKCNRFEDAIGVYGRLRQVDNVRPDEATIVSTLSACSAIKDLELGKKIHEYVRNEDTFSVAIGNALLDMYSKCGCLTMARQIFDNMPDRNVVCWTSMVSGYVNRGHLDEARELFEMSPVRDLVLWTDMINGYVQYNRADVAIELFRDMQMEGVKPDKFTLVTLLTGCAQPGTLEQGEWIHGYIKEANIPIDNVVGTALMEMYAKCGFVDRSLEIFDIIKAKDTASWTSIICAFAMNGKTNKALELFAEMKLNRVKPDDITFIGVLSACSHGGLLEEGREHFNSMKAAYGIEPKLEHYSCLIDLFGRAGLLREAEDMITNIPNRKDNIIIIPLYGALLSACRTYGNVDMGERIADLLMQMDCKDSSTHALLGEIYASANRWEEVGKIRRRTSAMRLKKSPGCSAIIDVDCDYSLGGGFCTP